MIVNKTSVLGSRFHVQQSKDTSVSYMGYAIKSAKHA